MSLDNDLAKYSKEYSTNTKSVNTISSDQSDFVSLPDESLIKKCLDNDKAAWEEFFRRFIPDIIKGIRRGLRQGGRGDLCRDNDVIWDIHKRIVKKLYSERKISQNLDPTRLRPWLFSVGVNHARDWLKRSRQTKRLPEADAERSRRSMSEPLPGKQNLTLEDTIPQPEHTNEQLTRYLAHVIDKFKDIENEKLYWTLRLTILAYFPLSDSELKRLSDYAGQSLEILNKQISIINRKLEEKEKKKIHSLARAVVLWHEIRHLEAELCEKIKGCSCPENEVEIERLVQKIEKKERRRELYLKQEQVINKPSNADIGKILGLPEDKVGQISRIVSEARKLLKKSL